MTSKLVNRFGELRGIAEADRTTVFDNFVRRAMYYEKLQVVESHPGQPRMGRGLLGDNDSRLIRFDFDQSTDKNMEPPASEISGA